MPQPTILVLVRDLLFASKISGAAQAINVSIRLIRDADRLTSEDGDRLIVDLNQAGAMEAAIQWKNGREGRSVVGFVSHVDRETIDRARADGVDHVMPRSAFVQQLNQLLNPGDENNSAPRGETASTPREADGKN